MTIERHLLILIMLISPRICAQTNGLSEATKTEINNFEQRHLRSLANKYEKLIGNESDFSILYIYSLDLHDSVRKKEFFKEKTFLSYLKGIKGQESNKSFLRGQSFAINNGDKKIIISGQDNQVFKFPTSGYLNKRYEQIVKAKSTNSDMTFFHISGSNGMVYFGITDSDIYVFDIQKNVTSNLIDFVDNSWGDYLVKGKNASND